MIDIRAIPIYLDGSDGSLWASRNTWDDVLTDRLVAERRYIRISDLLLWLESNQYPTMDLAELLSLSIQHATKSKERASALASSCAKTASLSVLSSPETEPLNSSAPTDGQ
jgi:hypothetical protein